jgi:hypothetical protein
MNMTLKFTGVTVLNKSLNISPLRGRAIEEKKFQNYLGSISSSRYR